MNAQTNQGESPVDKAGVQSTFSTTLNKKSHANQHLLYGFDPVFESRAPVQGQAKISLLLMALH